MVGGTNEQRRSPCGPSVRGSSAEGGPGEDMKRRATAQRAQEQRANWVEEDGGVGEAGFRIPRYLLMHLKRRDLPMGALAVNPR